MKENIHTIQLTEAISFGMHYVKAENSIWVV